MGCADSRPGSVYEPTAKVRPHYGQPQYGQPQYQQQQMAPQYGQQTMIVGPGQPA